MTLIYEHPLNEKMRVYLRLEHLFSQLTESSVLQLDYQHSAFFEALFSAIEILERNDIRGDLSKDLESTERQLVHWSQSPEIDDSLLSETLVKVIELQGTIAKLPRVCQQLKEDKFLMSLKQRFSIPGGSCAFDLPHLHFWLNQPLEQRDKDLQRWLSILSPLQQSLAILLTIIRSRGEFETISSDGGFYQGNAERVELLRIRYSPSIGAFPTVSGNKYRYAIRFMQLCDDQAKMAFEQTVQFDLASC